MKMAVANHPDEKTRQQKRLKNAKRLLAGGRGVARDDSDDELGSEDHPWEYIYAHDGTDEIVGARMGSFECSLGDTLLLKADGTNEAWVGLLCQFGNLNVEHATSESGTEKAAFFMWFSTEKEIRNKKKRTDSLQHELYITPSWDWNPLATINGKASILSFSDFNEQYPAQQIPRTSPKHDKTFFCRRGCNTRTAKYTDEFNWTEIYRNADDIHSLVEFVRRETWSSRKRKRDSDTEYAEPSKQVSRFEHGGEVYKTPTKNVKISLAAGKPTKSPSTFLKHAATPRHQKKIVVKRPLEYSPLATRVLSPRQGSSPFQKARSQLHVSSVPTSLPCREEAFAAVYGHLEAAITEGIGSCIYISGTPGTGKTATVREVVARLDMAVHGEELEDFIFVEINGMKLTEPQQSYVQLWQALRGETVSAAHALDLLEQEFSHPNPRRIPCVVLMDELDQLVTKSQSVMYNFFNWPSLRHSRLIVLAVANTMDLPERTLSNKISSRLGLTRIPFAGYSHTDLIKIIQSRLEDVPGNIVEPDAIQFASRKVAAVSGDARRALDICRRAVEIAEVEHMEPSFRGSTDLNVQRSKGEGARKQQGRVTIATIKRAITEATSSPTQQSIRGLSNSAKLILAALVAYSKRSGVAEGSLTEIVEKARAFASTSEEAWVRGTLLQQMLTYDASVYGVDGSGALSARPMGLGFAVEELIEIGVITVEARRGDRIGKIRLNTSEEEVRSSLKDDEQVRRLGFIT